MLDRVNIALSNKSLKLLKGGIIMAQSTNKIDNGTVDTNASYRIKVSKKNAVSYRKEPSTSSPAIGQLESGKTSLFS